MPGAALKKTEVLIIDDDDSFRTETAALLRSNGYGVTEARSSEALVLFSQTWPDVVITELVMPGLDGLELIPRLRKLRSDLTIIAISGGFRAFMYLKIAQLLGAKATLEKPFPADKLLELLGGSGFTSGTME